MRKKKCPNVQGKGNSGWEHEELPVCKDNPKNKTTTVIGKNKKYGQI